MADFLISAGCNLRQPFHEGAGFYSMTLWHQPVLSSDGDADFRHAIFEGGVDFSDAQIGGDLSVSNAQFKSVDSPADFNSIQIEESAFFDNVTFSGPVDFITAEIAGQFNFDDRSIHQP
jgi:uncharacterized protein YjbI with pentapeptide repeats